jgi:hypothetical protein
MNFCDWHLKSPCIDVIESIRRPSELVGLNGRPPVYSGVSLSVRKPLPTAARKMERNSDARSLPKAASNCACAWAHPFAAALSENIAPMPTQVMSAPAPIITQRQESVISACLHALSAPGPADDQRFDDNIANDAPCGSVHWTIHCPVGTGVRVHANLANGFDGARGGGVNGIDIEVNTTRKAPGYRAFWSSCR